MFKRLEQKVVQLQLEKRDLNREQGRLEVALETER
jgi:hypothetical protein